MLRMRAAPNIARFGFPAGSCADNFDASSTSKMKHTPISTLASVIMAAMFPWLSAKAQKHDEHKTFILVHGSWHSAWNWHKVTPLLQAAGHTVYAIDLPGMGRDKTPIETVTLEMSVKRITDIIDSVDGKVVLVGHSKNGIMISQAAEYRPEKIDKLVYLAAYLVPNGKTQREYSMQDSEGVLKPYVVRHESTNSSTLKHEIYKEGLYHDCPADIVELAKVILSEEPFVTGVTRLHLTDENFGRVPRYYIECTDDRAVTPYIQQKMYTELPCKKVFKMNTSHSPFFSQPEELVEILKEIAGE
jgi:pimeloyl-ACP methyl ester carboxylesterase